MYYYPGHRIQNQFCTRVHFLHSLGSIPASRHFTGAHNANSTTISFASTGSPFNTWVESSNVDKVSCWRTKLPGDSGIRTRALNVRIERSHHYTTAPPIHVTQLDNDGISDSMADEETRIELIECASILRLLSWLWVGWEGVKWYIAQTIISARHHILSHISFSSPQVRLYRPAIGHSEILRQMSSCQKGHPKGRSMSSPISFMSASSCRFNAK